MSRHIGSMHRLSVSIAAFPFTLLVALSTVAASPANAADYTVRWTADGFPVAQVVARLRSATCTFGTSDHWATFFDDTRGWSRFVSSMRAIRDGHELPVEADATGHWRVGAGDACEVELRYAVDFSFGRRQWPAGNEQVAYTDDRAVYTTGLPLFVLDDDRGPATIRFEVPEGWQVATPWTPTGDRLFRAPNRDALLSNTLVVGRASVGTFQAARFSVTIAMLGDLAPSAPLVARTFSKLVPNYVSLFHDDHPGRYMVAMIPGPEDGESFSDSFAVATKETATESNKIIWANHLAHELLHYWMGGKLGPAEPDERSLKWFTEGFTEYLANRALLEEGIYSEADSRARMGRHLGAYVMTRENPNFRKIAPSQAGEKAWANRPLIYSGGASIAFCLDARIRSLSDGKRTLRDLLGVLSSESAGAKHLSYGAIREAASRAAGSSLDEFFRLYVEGTDALPLPECASAFGLVARTHNHDVFLTRD